MYKRAVCLAILVLLLGISSVTYAAPVTITPGTEWYDTSSNPIAAQGAGVIKVGSTYYMVGMYTDNDPANWVQVSGGHGTPLFVGITCYSSTDLANWTFENYLLTQQPSGDLVHTNWVGRPKVIKNDTTGNYVMYMSVEDPLLMLTQRLGQVGVSTCPTVNGNYTYLGRYNPLGDKVFDNTLFKDTDGKAYLIAAGVKIYQLTSDYLGTASLTKTIRNSGEAPAMFKVGSTYYLLVSGSTWWTSNDNYYYTASSLSGTWTKRGDFTPGSTNTCNSQTTYVQPIQGTSTTSYMYMGDRWDEWNFGNSTYIWLPLTVNGTTVTMDYYDSWRIDTATGQWDTGPCTVADTHVQAIVCSLASGSQGKKKGQAAVTIKDNCGTLVSGANVTGAFSGSFFNETVSATTNSSGIATLITTAQASKPTFTFCVTNVTGTLPYHSADNVVTCGSY